MDKYDTGVNAKLGDVWFQLKKSKGLNGTALPRIRIDTDQTGVVLID